MRTYVYIIKSLPDETILKLALRVLPPEFEPGHIGNNQLIKLRIFPARKNYRVIDVHLVWAVRAHYRSIHVWHVHQQLKSRRQAPLRNGLLQRRGPVSSVLYEPPQKPGGRLLGVFTARHAERQRLLKSVQWTFRLAPTGHSREPTCCNAKIDMFVILIL